MNTRASVPPTSNPSQPPCWCLNAMTLVFITYILCFLLEIITVLEIERSHLKKRKLGKTSKAVSREPVLGYKCAEMVSTSGAAAIVENFFLN